MPSTDTTASAPASAIPTTVLGLSSPLPYRPVEEVVLGPSSPVGGASWADTVHRLAQEPRRPSCTPAYYLGRSAETWLAALGTPISAVQSTIRSAFDRRVA